MNGTPYHQIENIRDIELGNKIVAAVLSAVNAGVTELSDLLDILPDELGAHHWRLALLAQLRLGGLINRCRLSSLSSKTLQLALFLRVSHDLRHKVATVRAHKLTSMAQLNLIPIKYALALLYLNDRIKPRYFRDIDFVFCGPDFSECVSNLTALGYIAGDLCPSDWNRYLVTEEKAVRAAALEMPEIHFFAFDEVTGEIAATMFEEISEFYPALVETQFYTTYKNRVFLRTFLDVEFPSPCNEETARLKKQPWNLYWRSFLESLQHDATNLRVGVNQFVDFLHEAPQDVKRKIDSDTLKDCINTAVNRFVLEKLQSVRRMQNGL